MNPEIFPRAFINILLLALTSLFAGTAIAEQKGHTAAELTDMMKQGGLVIYIRHAATDRSKEDQYPIDIERCETQRNLSDLGKTQASTIGSAFKRLEIPVGQVLSSPYCRCKDTANIAFGRFEINPNLYFAVASNKSQRAAQSDVLVSLISGKPDEGNRIIVSHTGNLREAVKIWPKPEGVAYIFEPKGDGNYKVLGSIKPDEWDTLGL